MSFNINRFVETKLPKVLIYPKVLITLIVLISQLSEILLLRSFMSEIQFQMTVGR